MSPSPFALRCTFNLSLKLGKSCNFYLHPTKQILISLNNYTDFHFGMITKSLDHTAGELKILPSTWFCFKLVKISFAVKKMEFLGLFTG